MSSNPTHINLTERGNGLLDGHEGYSRCHAMVRSEPVKLLWSRPGPEKKACAVLQLLLIAARSLSRWRVWWEEPASSSALAFEECADAALGVVTGTLGWPS